MKKTFVVALAAVSLTLTSCFKAEPLNAECDITRAWVHLSDPLQIFASEEDTAVNVLSDVSDIVFEIKDDSVYEKNIIVNPQFLLTEGATIDPPSGTEMDFAMGEQVYTVTSQDRNWQRTYTVHFIPRQKMPLTSYGFENIDTVQGLRGLFIEWFDLGENDTRRKDWSTANAGFDMAMPSPDPSNYPSASCEGYSGRGVQLKTLSTGLFGQMSSKPIAAGNLFLGQFNLTKAMSAPLKSTEFGIKFTKKPLYVTGYYKFTSGGEAVDHNTKQVVSPKDQGTIYAVFFKNKDKNKNLVVLTGEDVKTNENIVALSSLTIDDDSNANWKQFKLDLTNTKEPIDKNLLMRGGYSLTIVASSSIQGDKFIGAIGSTLCIDEIKIECE